MRTYLVEATERVDRVRFAVALVGAATGFAAIVAFLQSFDSAWPLGFGSVGVAFSGSAIFTWALGSWAGKAPVIPKSPGSEDADP